MHPLLYIRLSAWLVSSVLPSLSMRGICITTFLVSLSNYAYAGVFVRL